MYHSKIEQPQAPATVLANDKLALNVQYNPDAGLCQINWMAGELDTPSQVVKVWVVPASANDPVAIGTLANQQSAEILLSQTNETALQMGMIAISVDDNADDMAWGAGSDVIAIGAISNAQRRMQ